MTSALATMISPVRPLALATLVLAAAACRGDGGGTGPAFGRPGSGGAASTPLGTTPSGQTMRTLGLGAMGDRFTGEVAVRGTTAYTTTWGRRSAIGNAIHVWDVSGDVPRLADSVLVSGAATLGDVQISDDGRYLLVATEFSPGSVVLYSLADPRRPQLVSRFSSASTAPGVHTAKLARVNGTLHAFLAVDPPSHLVVLDLSIPTSPREILSRPMGDPFVHDVFVRDGLLFTALWFGGLTIWDVGGGGRGGTPAAPVSLGNVATANGEVHNVAWVRLPNGGGARYAWVGQEGPGNVTGAQSSGDVHVVDVTDLSRPREVAVYRVAGAGPHNFVVDESAGIVYAAYYNAGVRALDARGDLSECTAAQRLADGRCDLGRMGRELGHGLAGIGRDVFVWGVALDGGALYASDMLNGLWKLQALTR